MKPSNQSSRTSTLTHYLPITVLVVSNIEAIQSQLKNIYTNTLSTLCPLPWLEKSEDVQYNFDDVFIPLRAIDIDIQQTTEVVLFEPSESRDDKEQLYDVVEPTYANRGAWQTADLSRPSNSRHKERNTNDLSEPVDRKQR